MGSSEPAKVACRRIKKEFAERSEHTFVLYDIEVEVAIDRALEEEREAVDELQEAAENFCGDYYLHAIGETTEEQVERSQVACLKALNHVKQARGKG